ncbi:hypothetical protein [Longimycelium tulufanense]|uniref:hypothetical protein n=1 Tax=Longimycelium tulufanense TaxID=907463 RepID=UPI001E61D03D|nr:hypothetical protein [Longimycelium tulufanense]
MDSIITAWSTLLLALAGCAGVVTLFVQNKEGRDHLYTVLKYVVTGAPGMLGAATPYTSSGGGGLWPAPPPEGAR